eukprot:TRINITY_DN22973_c0_g1_i1.p1 TRINITY_DN22973_c0_g1~~TRINITY_DN22973_c0_g1_i1.p1  ORF type:complete len:370 (+),score=151.32 TRINITY_DN22973_c0_g1_i1:60-1169(+)
MMRRAGRAVARRAAGRARRWCAGNTAESKAAREMLYEQYGEGTEDDWVLLGHLDRPLDFIPSEHHGEDVVRAETEMYHLYRKIEDGEVPWTDMVDLFTVCDQELVASAFMWTMYLKIIPTLFGLKREYSRLNHFSHEFDTNTLNVVMLQMFKHHSSHEGFRFYIRHLVGSNKRISNPNMLSLCLMLEQVVPTNDLEDSWWLDRGILYVNMARKRPNILRRKIFDKVQEMPFFYRNIIAICGTCFEMLDRHRLEPDFTFLHLLARAIPVDVDYGRLMATRLVMFMESLDDEVVPFEVRMLVTEYLHWKMDNVAINPAICMMAGPLLSPLDKVHIFMDDCRQALLHPFKPPGSNVLQGEKINKNQVRVELA